MVSNCRFCESELSDIFLDLGVSPLSNSFVSKEYLNSVECFFPLKVYVCGSCFLVQLDEFEKPSNIFNSDYAYHSSYSESWLKHAEKYTEKMAELLHLNQSSSVMEIASNDGYLLQYFNNKNIPVVGIEPAENVAEVARAKGIETICEFFSEEFARKIVAERGKFDLILGNNVLAHVPKLKDFVSGLKIALAEDGVITLEFPHLMRLIEEHQFDTIYHEHFSYFSLITLIRVFDSLGFKIINVDELQTHGGSLRIYVCHKSNSNFECSENVDKVIAKEKLFGLEKMETYNRFQSEVDKTKYTLVEFLLKAKREGKSIAGYGAPAKGNTLLNFCGIRSDLLPYTVDRSKEKQGKFLPGTRIPVYSPDKLSETKPDYILILPWNLKEEISKQLEYSKSWNCQLVVPIPYVEMIK